MLAAIENMVPFTRRLFTEGPGSISAHLYWWRDGSLAWIPSDMANDSISLHPTTEFLEMLNLLNLLDSAPTTRAKSVREPLNGGLGVIPLKS